MAHRDGASSVQGNAIRITRLKTDGAIEPDFPVLTTRGFISATFSPEFEEGDEIAEKRADGGVCISWKADDTLKRLNFSLALCSPDPEAAALLAGGKIICDAGGEVIGYTSPEVGSVAGTPVAIEIWSIANVGGKPGSPPYWHWAFPYVKVRYEGDREFGNSALTNEFTGQALGNAALSPNGLNPINVNDDFVVYKQALDNPFSYVRSAALPAFGWKEGAVGQGNQFSNDPDVALGACAVGPLEPLATIGTAPSGSSSEPNGSIRVVTGTGVTWLTRAGTWVQPTPTVTLTPIPAKIDIVEADPVATPPSGTFVQNDVVWWDDGLIYKGYVRGATVFAANTAYNITK